MNTELAPVTHKDLNTAGISVALTQNDLVEILAAEMYEHITSESDRLILAGKKFAEQYNDRYESQKNFFKATLLKKKLLVKENVSVHVSDAGNDGNQQIIAPYPQEQKGGIYFQQGNAGYIYLPIKGSTVRLDVTNYTPTLSEKTLDNGKIEVSKQVTTTYTYKFTPERAWFDELAEEIREHNQAVLDFLETVGQKLISPETLAKTARLKLNKSILKSKAPDIQEKLRSLLALPAPQTV